MVIPSNNMLQTICIILSVAIFISAQECKPSITTASGPDAPKNICSGQLVYHEPFDDVNKTKWAPLVTFWDGGVSRMMIGGLITLISINNLD